MKRPVAIAVVFCLVLAPFMAYASDISIERELSEMKIKLDMASQAMYAKCWKTCSDDDYGKLNCTTTCDDGNDSGGSSSGGSNLFTTPEGIILGSVLLVGIIALVWYMADQSNAAAGI